METLPDPDVLTSSQDAAPKPAFFRINASRVTYAECRYSNSVPASALSWVILKLIGRQIPASTDDPPVESLYGFEVEEYTLPAVIRDLFAKQGAELKLLGFHSPTFHTILDHLHKTETHLATFAHTNLPMTARVHVRIWALKSPPTTRAFIEFITAYQDGTFLWSQSCKGDLHPPPSCTFNRRVNAPASELFAAHKQAIARKPALQCATPEHVQDVAEVLHQSVVEYHLGRGVFVQRSLADAEVVSAAAVSLKQANAGQSRYPEVMVELEKLQRGKTGWLGPILILAISLGLFLAIGLSGSSFLFVLSLVPILFFHECGHYLFMKIFGYRNLRMFFIPGLGAAVTGRHYNIAAWKKAVVFLMGPVPGIVLGIIIGLCGMVWNFDLALKAALLMLILNGINLLPLLPMDGGHVVQIVLFSRNHILDVVMRALAAIIVVALGIALNIKWFIFLAIMMFAGLPLTFRIARVVRQLRKEGVAAASPDDQSIPADVAERIITLLREGAKTPQQAKLVAQQTLSVFETLNTRPPKLLASIGLISVHALSFLAAAAFSLVFILGQQGSFTNMLYAAANRPTHTVPAMPAESTPAPASAPSKRIVATFKSSELAAAAYADATASLPPGQRVSRFASTVIIEVPANDTDARDKSLTLLEATSKDAFVESESLRASFWLYAVAPTSAAAESIEKEVGDYFQLPLEARVLPPWSSSTVITPEQRLARDTLSKLREAHFEFWEDPRLEDLQNEMSKALRRGDQEAHKALIAKSEDLYRTIRLERIKAVAADPAANIDRALSAKYLDMVERLDPEAFDKAYAQEFGSYLGQAPEPASSAGPHDQTFALSGFCFRTGLIVQFSGLTFGDPAKGGEEVVAWLRAKGCKRLYYDLLAEPSEFGPD